MDDTSTSSTSAIPRIAGQVVQKHVKKIVKFLTKWKIKINAGKTEAIVFRYYKKKYRVRQSPLLIIINGHKVAYKDS
ncbi:hypothetical protein Bhyg_14654 [Pseudolycoriella hygida]|uniref:Reverse transcriptase domain-containing protein n=1 Tax=Pseudolycoriella hygida TaxID=35572 RepID=A0A9Q0MTL3_9DIPT|nr:hypothetical protein Bhyg_14654 [Pseudolycoriella hygida]